MLALRETRDFFAINENCKLIQKSFSLYKVLSMRKHICPKSGT